MKSYDKKKKIKKNKEEVIINSNSNSDSSDSDSEKEKNVENKINKRNLTIKDILKKEWLIGNKKKITFSDFRKRKYVDLRNYYESDGELKPTKKGISLSVDEFLELAKIFDEVKSYVEMF